MTMTKIICIEIEKPKYCPYRVACVREGKRIGMLCVRSNRPCTKNNTFPDWCMLLNGRYDDN